MDLEPVGVIIYVLVISSIRIACCTFYQLSIGDQMMDILVVVLSILNMVLSHNLDFSM